MDKATTEYPTENRNQTRILMNLVKISCKSDPVGLKIVKFNSTKFPDANKIINEYQLFCNIAKIKKLTHVQTPFRQQKQLQVREGC